MRVVVADDQTAVREGLVTLLSTMPDIEVVGSAGDGEQALALIAQTTPDVVLMDLRMPRLDGVEATRRIRAAHPGTQIVVLTTYADDQSILDALRAGAIGYLTKDAGRDHIRRAIEAAATGQAVLDPAVQARLVQVAHPPSVASDTLPDGLTDREAQVLRLISSGMSNGESPRSCSSARPPSRPTSTTSSPRPAAETEHRRSPMPTATASTTRAKRLARPAANSAQRPTAM
jgi:DNA-binding NarL/FixJ family response regulator